MTASQCPTFAFNDNDHFYTFTGPSNTGCTDPNTSWYTWLEPLTALDSTKLHVSIDFDAANSRVRARGVTG